MIIERTTEDCHNETVELFNRIQPLLDNGESYSSACKIVLGKTSIGTNLAWYQNLIKYGESQGYAYKDYFRKDNYVCLYKRLKVVEQTTKDRHQETVDLFNKIKPLLDAGMSWTNAVKQARGIRYNAFANQRWYKDLREYAESQGYYNRWSRKGKLINGGHRI